MSLTRRRSGPTRKSTVAILAAVTLTLHAPGGSTKAAEPVRYEIDAAASTVMIHVGRAGILGFAGHIHEVAAPAVTGWVVADTLTRSFDVSLSFASASLKVVDKNESPDTVAEIQQTMLGPRVLDAGRFPAITYRLRSLRPSTPGRGTAAEVALDEFDGDVTLHGVTRRMVAKGVASAGPDVVRARGSITIKQTDFGIKPVTAAGGTIRVRDELDISFDLVARRKAP